MKELYGKPYILNKYVNFNISHAAKIVIAAYSQYEEIGIDIEQINSIEFDAFRNVFLDYEFNEILNEYNNIMENLLIYLIYKYFMIALYTKNLYREVNNVLISYAVIKMLLLARWYKNNKKLEEEDFIEIFYLFSLKITFLCDSL